MTCVIERSIMTVGLDSEKRIFSEKMRRKGIKRGKEAIRYGKSTYYLIKFNHFIGIQIWQYDK